MKSGLELLLAGIRTNNKELFYQWKSLVCRHESDDVLFEHGYGYNCTACHKWSKDGTFTDNEPQYE